MRIRVVFRFRRTASGSSRCDAVDECPLFDQLYDVAAFVRSFRRPAPAQPSLVWADASRMRRSVHALFVTAKAASCAPRVAFCCWRDEEKARSDARGSDSSSKRAFASSLCDGTTQSVSACLSPLPGMRPTRAKTASSLHCIQ